VTLTQIQDLETNSESPVTAISSDPGSSATFLASFADGTVKVFDRRLEEEDSIVRAYRGHTSWVQNVRWHPFLIGQFFSARYVTFHISWVPPAHVPFSLDGEVKLWDLRGHHGPLDVWTRSEGISAFDVHSQSGVFGMCVRLHYLNDDFI
jgi:regulatory associated protein of mTOR